MERAGTKAAKRVSVLLHTGELALVSLVGSGATAQ